MIRVTYIDQYYKTLDSVGGTRVFEMTRRLSRLGFAVSVVSTENRDGKSGTWRTTNEDGVVVHRLGQPYSNRMSHVQRMRAFARFAGAASRRAAGIPADVIFASSTPLTIAIPAILVKRRLRVPMVFEVRDLWPEIPIALGVLKNPVAVRMALWLEETVYSEADQIVALSLGMRDGIVASGTPVEKVVVIPNGSDLELFGVPPSEGLEWRRRNGIPEAAPLALYAGTLGRVNAVSWLVRVAAEARCQDDRICFVVVGDGAERERVEAEARRLGVLGNAFRMLGSMPKREMPAIHSAATVCLSLVRDEPALWHNSANKFFDALAAGRPMAVNYGGWQAELLRESDAGFVLPVGDVSAAAHEIVARARDVEWLQRAGFNARHLAESRFDRDGLALQMAEVLTRAAKSRTQAVRERAE